MTLPAAGRLALLVLSVLPLLAAACGEASPPEEARAAAATAEVPAVVDATTLEHKMLFGYQGWFLCPGDGSPVNGWTHWFRDGAGGPSAANLSVDLWPDTAELGADELHATDLRYPDGSAARLYSAYEPKTVARHFTWMRQAGIDGVALQRFASELVDPARAAARDQVARNVQAAAEAEGRVFAIEYDVTGVPEADLVATVESDWRHLVDTLGLTGSPRYLRDGGRPVLFLWGLGFTSRPGTPAEAAALTDWLTTSADPRYRVTLVGGVPAHWRTLDGDAKTDPAWASVYRSFDVLSPWTVGRFADDAGADAYRATLAADLAAVTAAGRRYLPVVFPGFSWHNLDGGP